jgi:hypothetical protein
MRQISLILCVFGTFAAGCLLAPENMASALSPGTFAATLQAQFGVDLVAPFVPFEPSSSRALLPGSTLIGAEVQTLADKSRVVRLAGATLCTASEIKPINPQRAYEYTGADLKFNAQEATLLFGLAGGGQGLVQGYKIQLSKVRLLTIPFDRLKQLAARTSADPKCGGPASGRAVISRSLIATIDVTITSERPLESQVLERIGRSLSPSSPVTLRKDRSSAYTYSVILVDHWVGIRIESQP